MSDLHSFWTWVYLIGLSSFFLLALLIIPLGGKDLKKLFGQLHSERDAFDESTK